MGDMQSDYISYNKFKRTLVKRNIEVKQLIGKISEELSKLLNEMNTMRNWGLHEPESLKRTFRKYQRILAKGRIRLVF
ncbi:MULTISPECIES: hypothetical protein [unclassified Peribacillus]|uniref:hypothetical protein n=1 Tax=unclassified Peribacillus TaxID=2675266 RepID=UPI001913B4F5|nr:MULTISPECIES: hypothetical protein [unclassified Peribacillus]MBK5446320.1 hypothetical protein [Peribacillus sp. TH24]